MTRRLAGLALALTAGACAVSPYSHVSAFAEHTDANSFELFDGSLSSTEALVLPVAHDRQTQGPSCGAHVLASVINYWRQAPTVTGREIFEANPPASDAGYSMAELVTLAQTRGLLASAVRLSEENVVEELERGRPVLVPVRLPVIYIQQRALPGGNIPIVGFVRSSLINRAGRFSELGDLGMVDHYLLVVGYEDNTLVIVEPVMGYRTISNERLARYRIAFDDAAIVFSRRPRSD